MQASKGDRLITPLGELEVVNALGLRVFRKEVSAAQAQSSLDNLHQHYRHGVSGPPSCGSGTRTWRRLPLQLRQAAAQTGASCAAENQLSGNSGTGTKRALPATVVRPSSVSMKVEAS